MNKTALVLATVGTLGLSAVAAPTPAEARWRGGFGPALAGGLLAGAVIGGLASSAYAYGPGYGYYGYPGYYDDDYAPAYYGGYDPYPWGGYTTTYYSTSYAPAYYGYGYRRVVRPAYAYYGGSFPRRHFYHYRYRHW
ncbi:MAG TPA: hypothetical protein VJR30_01905 [Bradyrhizobium sp.]|nr:hypothetical protein [Bradyrhizobium sp.]